MQQFYQSSLWRTINEQIYKKPIGEITLGGTTYRTISKIQKRFGKTLCRTMVHGVHLSDTDHLIPSLREELQQYSRDHRDHLFLQLGRSTPRKHFLTKNTEQHRDSLKKEKQYLDSDLYAWYGVRPTVREHMPQATILLTPQATREETVRECSESGKRMINKAKRAGLSFHTASSVVEREQFRSIWYTMSYDKGFSVLPKDQFLALMQFLSSQDAGRLFVAKQGSTIVCGSLCLRVGDELIYLYGATDRSFGAIGAHYRLMIHIVQRAYQQGCTTVDLLGIAPPRQQETHHLGGVTRFKQSLGGKTIVSIGSYDLVIRPLQYKAFQLWRRFRG